MSSKKTKVVFCTSSYERSHGKTPRGYGSWAFSIDGSEPFWAHGATYGQAKKVATAEAQKRGAGLGFSWVEVLP